LGKNKKKPDSQKRKTGSDFSSSNKAENKTQFPSADLSKLSMEERMAVYKKKYGKTAAGKTENSGGTASSRTASSRTSSSRTSSSRIPKKQNRKHPLTSDQQQQAAVQQDKPDVKQNIEQKPQETPGSKKGFFEKIKGIFIKK
jgi:hypothetical protein